MKINKETIRKRRPGYPILHKRVYRIHVRIINAGYLNI